MSDCKFRRKMVSFTALNTTLMFSVSTAVVKWWNKGLRGSLLAFRKYSMRKSCTSIKLLSFPAKSGKNQRMFVSPDFSFSASKSVLFRNRMMETSLKIWLFTMVSNIFFDSSKRFVRLKEVITFQRYHNLVV